MPIYRVPVNIAYNVGSKRGVNTWHIRTTAAVVPPSTSTIDLIKNFYTAIRGMFPSSMSFTFDGILTEAGTATPTVVGALTPWTVTGNFVNNSYGAAGVGLCVGWRSSLATRRGRGRTFLAPLATGIYDTDGTLVDTYVTTLRTAAAALCTGSLADGNGAVSVYSPTDNVARDIVSSKVNDQVAWLSSRRS